MTDNKPPMLVMEFVQGRDLYYEHREKRMTKRELIRLTEQLLGALAYVHEKGITHRDVKPANVMVSSRSPLKVKLADFDLASKDADLRTRCGTERYLAPEIDFGKDDKYTSKVDIWSFGVMFLELCYNLPKRTKEIDQQAWVALILRYLANQDQTTAVHFASTLLKKSPDCRPSAKECLGHKLFSVLDNEDLVSIPDPEAYDSPSSSAGTTTRLYAREPYDYENPPELVDTIAVGSTLAEMVRGEQREDINAITARKSEKRSISLPHTVNSPPIANAEHAISQTPSTRVAKKKAEASATNRPEAKRTKAK